MHKELIKKAAESWLDDWNGRRFDQVMNHYADDVAFYSPTVITRWNESSGRLNGRQALERHFRKGFEETPGMQFTFHNILYGQDSVVLLYHRETGTLAADYVLFDETGKVKEVRSHW